MPQLRPADWDDSRVLALLNEHATRALNETERGCGHALDAATLRSADLEVWCAWEGDELRGVGALKRLSPDHGELKSMYTAPAARRSGVGSVMIRHLIDRARDSGMARLSLETGSWPYFDAARAFYRRHGFTECEAFGDYPTGDHSVFMTLVLTAER